MQATDNTGAFFGVAQDASTTAADQQFSVTSYHVNGTQIVSPDRNKLYDAILNQGLLSTDYSRAFSDHTYKLSYPVAGFGYLQLQEVIIYHTDQSSNRSGIETDINTYFSIY